MEYEGLAKQVQSYVADGGSPFVLAVPDGNASHHDDTEWADAADGSDRVEDRLMDEVIPAVEGGHRRDAAHRAIGGFSMGGYGSMNLALRHPAVFGAVASISGYFHVDDPSHMFGDREDLIAANRPDREPRRRPPDPDLPGGRREREQPGGQGRAAALQEAPGRRGHPRRARHPPRRPRLGLRTQRAPRRLRLPRPRLEATAR